MPFRNPYTVRVFNLVEPVTTFYRDLIPYWESKGWQVEVVISRAEYRPGREHSMASDQTRMHWTPAFGLKARGRVSKVIVMLAYVISGIFVSLVGPRVDFNLFLTQPPLFFCWGGILRRLRHQKYLITLMDLYPDVAVQAGMLPSKGLLTRVLRRLSKYGLLRSGGIVTIGRCMKDRLVRQGIPASIVHIIPNWADQDNIVPLPHTDNLFRQRMGWQDKFVVMYSGNMGVSHFFGDILDVANRLQRRQELLFVFVGRGERLPEIEQYKDIHRLENVLLLPFQPQDTLAQSLSAGDLHFACLRLGFTGLVVPSKVYGVLAAGRPILYQGDPGGEIGRLLSEEDIGRLVLPADRDGLEQAILQYLEDPSLAELQGNNGRLLVESRFGKRTAQIRYTALLGPKTSQGMPCQPTE